jgi:predicted GNAT family acetyltransferase
MAWTLTHDLVAYRAAAGWLLGSQPERNTVLASVLASLTRIGPAAFGAAAPLLGWWSDGGTVTAALLQTPPHPMLVTSLPGQSAGQLARALAGRGAALSGVNGPEADAIALATAWREVTGKMGQVRQRQRLYRLGTLVPPDPAPGGAPRIAVAADSPIAAAWHIAFGIETGQADAEDDTLTGRLADRLSRAQLVFWEAAGQPVSMAGLTDVLAGVARVAPVYTPPERRGTGYGAAVTAAISQLAFARGAESVVLFTDLANPTSNSLYGRLGYEPVEDRVVLDFGA